MCVCVHVCAQGRAYVCMCVCAQVCACVCAGMCVGSNVSLWLKLRFEG